ncbi:ATP phosphoribosyltransferase [Phaeobacter gallaeciensis]|uniref:Histidine--tRNA ligase n=1 Tax=Phaeobacter gallaeciensis TaxID=60890 RepID=A0A1B0ZPH6_9RHOB|nr:MULTISPECIES: ATP phosphoribosyltransferase regulatory subunit [Phaeobacter]ANP36055.1 ATP phosphoribosyltransferase [Phaeobacter gallaeciensis]MDE4062085.1 ATP phosphoribosyltransferase regulatory subunit [Phaeobacter gallaeciensis]MDE4125914.1 ATP phosphoribosyltransferase regulatory subunit [Phaeobacter gallaeciensis]MDE4129578.1 ATP phosphoribosyltransferase regulatory subunit [Phaeobacter gallaeciensis]PVZ46847.1 ATP phosphoribosyltransferase regulatory subunit [Phaeobacter sp. JL2872]
MPTRSEILARAARLRMNFEAAGAQAVEPPLLQPAETLLDLYGEDIRARAYITSDALRGEQMLRPDFTVPVVQMHMRQGADPARYTYSGEVFRRQEHDPDRANEYVQVGYEVFDRADPAGADAEVFALIALQLRGLPLRAATGDIGILMAAVEGLHTTDKRKSALMRHIWRPRRFRSLLERYAGRGTVPESRKKLLSTEGSLSGSAPAIGKRRAAEVDARVELLRADAAMPPISEHELLALEALMAVRETIPYAIEQMRDIAVDLPQILPALDRLEARSAAMKARGIDVDSLDFEASYGRTSMEYYDGFVFGFYAETKPGLPPVASGGRYDALTRQLGQGDEIPAVGGVLRPDLMLMLEEVQS